MATNAQQLITYHPKTDAGLPTETKVYSTAYTEDEARKQVAACAKRYGYGAGVRAVDAERHASA